MSWRTSLPLSLVLGLLSALAAALLLAAFRPVPMYPRGHLAFFIQWGSPWNLAEYRGFGVHDVWWFDLRTDYPDEPAAVIAEQRRRVQARTPDAQFVKLHDGPPPWGIFTRDTKPDAPIGSDTAFGFPIPCLWYSVRSEFAKSLQAPTIINERLEGGLLIRGKSPSARGRDFAAIPFRVAWRRLAFNALLLAGLWWPLLVVPGILRRVFRRRRGACEKCGYSQHGLAPDAACPECGLQRSDRLQR